MLTLKHVLSSLLWASFFYLCLILFVTALTMGMIWQYEGAVTDVVWTMIPVFSIIAGFRVGLYDK